MNLTMRFTPSLLLACFPAQANVQVYVIMAECVSVPPPPHRSHTVFFFFLVWSKFVERLIRFPEQ
jgi:hypothetical protein